MSLGILNTASFLLAATCQTLGWYKCACKHYMLV